MYANVLVATHRDDVAEEAVRHRTSRGQRFLGRLAGVVRELLLPTDPGASVPADFAREVTIPMDNATHHAIDVAAACGARLHVLFVIDSWKYDTSFESAVEPLREEGEVIVDRIVDEAERAGLAVTETIEVGRPARLIADYAAKHGVDLIVVNTPDRGGLEARLLEGVPGAVVRRTDVPVLAVPLAGPGEDDEASAE